MKQSLRKYMYHYTQLNIASKLIWMTDKFRKSYGSKKRLSMGYIYSNMQWSLWSFNFMYHWMHLICMWQSGITSVIQRISSVVHGTAYICVRVHVQGERKRSCALPSDVCAAQWLFWYILMPFHCMMEMSWLCFKLCLEAGCILNIKGW